MVAYASAIKIG